MDFAVTADHRIKLKGSEKKDKYPRSCQGIGKINEHEGDNYTNHDLCFWHGHRVIAKGNG